MMRGGRASLKLLAAVAVAVLALSAGVYIYYQVESEPPGITGNGDFRLDHTRSGCNLVFYTTILTQGGSDGYVCFGLTNLRSDAVENASVTVSSGEIRFCKVLPAYRVYCGLKEVYLCSVSNSTGANACAQLSNHQGAYFVVNCIDASPGEHYVFNVTLNYADGHSSSIAPRFGVTT